MDEQLSQYNEYLQKETEKFTSVENEVNMWQQSASSPVTDGINLINTFLSEDL